MMHSPSLEFLKSPFENVVNLLGGVPQGHEKALKHGLYNALALLVLLIGLAAGWALYIILEPFFKPLMWAVLCGCVLYPLKYSLSKSLEGWLDSLSERSTPLLVGIVIIPVQLIDDASEKVGNFLFVKYFSYIIGIIGAAIFSFLVYQYTPHLCICLIWQLGVQTNSFVTWMIAKFNIYLILTIVIGYVTVLVFYWHQEKSKHFTLAACIVWMFISVFVASLAPSFQVSVFFTVQLLLIAGFLYEVWLFYQKLSQSDKSITIFEAIIAVLHDGHPENTVDELNEKRQESEEAFKETGNFGETPKSVTEKVDVSSSRSAGNIEKVTEIAKEDSLTEIGKASEKVEYIRTRPVSSLPSLSSNWTQRTSITPATNRQYTATFMKHYPRRGSACNIETQTLESTKYLWGLLWACGILLFWINMWILPVVPVLLLLYGIKHTGHYFGVWQLIGGQVQAIWDTLVSWCKERQEALFPTPVSGLFKLMLWLNVKILDIVKDSVNMAASTVVILGLIFFTISTIAFLTVQIYSESILLLQMGGNAINNTFVKNSQLMELLPEGWQNSVDSVLDDAYSHGRQGISKLVQQSLKDVDPAKAEQLEKQVLELWDRIYQSWLTSNSKTNFVGPTVTSGAVFTSWDNIMDSVQKTPELFNMQAVVNFAKENVGTLLTVWDSIWNIFKGNISLAVDFCTALVAILFGGGTAVINFFINLIVFFTALFYLLTSSGNMYKPVDMITSFSPVNGKKFAVALEDALASVFIASFKRAVISGLWTWLIHNLFQVNLVYIPCVMATVFGAVPFIGTYWASFPATLELYFSQDRGLAALALLLVQFVAASMVDSAVYSEIKGGGHSYLTGLSIAGGMFCLGAEGAILGPMLLCAVYVAVNLSTSIMSESPSEPEIPGGMKRLSHVPQMKRTKDSASN